MLRLLAKTLAVQPPTNSLLCCWVSLGPSGLSAVLIYWSKVQSDGSGGLVHTTSDVNLLSLAHTETLCQNFGMRYLGLKEGFGLYLSENIDVYTASQPKSQNH